MDKHRSPKRIKLTKTEIDRIMERYEGFLVPVKERIRYRSPELTLIATNNPFALRPVRKPSDVYDASKRLLEMNCSAEFVASYARIEPQICALLRLHYTAHKASWWIRPQRAGFTGQHCPLVLQLVGGYGKITDIDAMLILREIEAMVSAQGEAMEDVYIDICEWSKDDIEQPLMRKDDNSKGKNLSANAISYIYANEVPLPGSSIGPRGGTLAGTLCGYVNCNGEVYGLTNAHVVGLSTPYCYTEKEDKIIISSPADPDQTATEEGLKKLVDGNLLRKPSPTKDEDVRKFTKFLETATKHNTQLGHIYASSGVDKSGKYHTGRLDWALIKCDRIQGNEIKNKFCSFNSDNRPNGFELHDRAVSYIEDQHENFKYYIAQDYFKSGPEFKPVRDINTFNLEYDVFLKPPSRSTLEWTDAVHNGMHHSRIDDKHTIEHSFISKSKARSYGSYVSDYGDSGSVMIDTDFRPSYMLWGGMDSVVDFTYGTPIAAILKDIERFLELPEGSAQFC